MSIMRLLRLVMGVLLFAGGVYFIVIAANKTYTAYPDPAPEDMRKVNVEDNGVDISHFHIADLACIDAITLYPYPSEDSSDHNSCEVNFDVSDDPEGVDESDDPENVDSVDSLDTSQPEARWVFVLLEAKAACDS